IEIQRVAPSFAAKPRQACATKRRTQIAQEPGIDPHHADMDTSRETVGPLQIASPQRSSQAVGRIIDALQHFLVAIEGRDMTDRTEHFFANAASVIGKAGPDSR